MRSSWVIRVGPNSDAGVLKGEAERDLRWREVSVEVEAETGGTRPQDKDARSHSPHPELGKARNDPPLKPSRGAQPC